MRWTQADLDAYRQRGGKQMPAALVPKAKRPKYGNRKVTDAAGAVHDSGKEYRRWLELQLRERAGEISHLHRQPVFDLIVNGVLVCRYVADAAYTEKGLPVVEDTKSEATRKNRAYRIKAKLFAAIHGFEIHEV
jgi:hypothetical protein